MTQSTGHNGFPGSTVQELEQTEREPFPTQPLELQTYPVSNFQLGYELDQMPGKTFSVHEGLLRLKEDEGLHGDRLTLADPEMVQSLKDKNYTEVSASVPFTGATNGDRRTNREFAMTEEAMVFLLAAKAHGVKNVAPREALTDEQKARLNTLGVNHVGKNGAIDPFYTTGLQVPRTEEETMHSDFLDKVGTYMIADAPTETGDEVVTVVMLVDSNGNKTVAGASQYALELLSDLGYTEVEDAPFDFDSIPTTTIEGRRFAEQAYRSSDQGGYTIPLRSADSGQAA